MKKKFRLIFHNHFNYELEHYWKRLEKESKIDFFQSHDWQKYWYENIKTKNKILIVLVFDDKDLIAIFPLNIEKKFNIKILNLNGFPFSDYNSLIIKKNYILDKKDFNQIIKDIKNSYSFDVLYFINLKQELKFFKSFQQNSSFGLNLKENILFIKLFKKFKKKIDYETKRIEKEFNVKYILNPNIEEKKEIINFFLINKEKQLKRTKAWNYLQYKNFKNYIINLIKLNSNIINFSCIKLEKKIIASHVGYTFNNIFYYIFPTYDVDYKKFSPGNILLLKIIDNLKNRDYKYIDYTVGNEEYKKKLSTNQFNLFSYIEYFNFNGFVFSIFIKLKIVLKKIFYLLKKKFK